MVVSEISRQDPPREPCRRSWCKISETTPAGAALLAAACSKSLVLGARADTAGRIMRLHFARRPLFGVQNSSPGCCRACWSKISKTTPTEAAFNSCPAVLWIDFWTNPSQNRLNSTTGAPEHVVISPFPVLPYRPRPRGLRGYREGTLVHPPVPLLADMKVFVRGSPQVVQLDQMAASHLYNPEKHS